MTNWGRLTQRDDVEVQSVGGMLERSASLAADKVALIYEDQRITYKEVNEAANAVAVALQSLGIIKDDRVAVILRNVPDLVYTFFGIAKIGAVTAWANPDYRTEKWEKLRR